MTKKTDKAKNTLHKTKVSLEKTAASTKAKVDNLTQTQKVTMGVGLTAAAVAAAGAYFLYGSKTADKNRESVKSWMLKAKAEVLERLEDAKHMSREEYEELIAAVAGTYAGVKGASKKDISEFAAEMQEHWHTLEKFGKPKKMKVEAKAEVKTPKKTTTKKKTTGKKTTASKSKKKADA
jgi:hypothetical protein